MCVLYLIEVCIVLSSVLEESDYVCINLLSVSVESKTHARLKLKCLSVKGRHIDANHQ